jgi:hypothetical protein
VGQLICGSVNGCIAVYKHAVEGNNDQGNNDQGDNDQGDK